MLSIIIPTLNEEKYLPFLLESIKKQKFTPFRNSQFLTGFTDYEIIVADANSQDRTLEIARSFGCKVVSGGLPARGRNQGAKVAQGEIFLFTDADNIFPSENFLENLIGEFKKRNLGIATFPIYPKGKKIDKILYGICNNLVNLTQYPAAFNSILVKREIFEKVGGFNEEIKIGEDQYFVKMAKKYGKFGFIKTEPVLTSPRRLEKEGRLKTYLKYYLIASIHFFLVGGRIKSDFYRYRFGYRLKNKK